MTMTLNGTSGVVFPDSSTQVSNANPQITVYTTGSGTYTVPTNAKYLHVRMIGAGGNGGGAAGATAGGGGGAGGYLEGLITSPTTSYAYTVGSSGSGNTTFGTSLFGANGGQAGTSNSTAAGGGAGGTATGGYLNITGASGMYGWASNPYYNGGKGAATTFGDGGSAGGTNNGSGSNAISYGAGGGGGVGGGGGGTGAGGVIIVTAYF